MSNRVALSGFTPGFAAPRWSWSSAQDFGRRNITRTVRLRRPSSRTASRSCRARAP